MSGLTKFFYSTMKGSPDLKDEWGSLNNVLKAVMVNGFNPVNVTSVELLVDSTVIVLPLGHGFIKHQVVSISGAIQDDFNGDYRVRKVTETSITIDYISTVAVTGVIIAKVASLGWDEKFTGDNKSVYTAKDKIKNKFHLRVDDSCPVGYNEKWAKFSRVTISDGMVGIDDFGDFTKAPYDSTDTDVNEKGNGVTGAGGIYGWAKWYHGFKTGGSYVYIYESEVTGIPVNHILNWEIVGNDHAVYIWVEVTNGNRYLPNRSILYMFTPIEGNNIYDTEYNCILSAFDTEKKESRLINSYLYNWTTEFSVGKSRGNFVLRDSVKKYDAHGFVSFFSLQCSTVSGNVSTISYPNPSDNSIILHDVYVKEGSSIRGTLPIMKWIHHIWYGGNKTIIDRDNGLYLILGMYYGNSPTETYRESYFAMKLE